MGCHCSVEPDLNTNKISVDPETWAQADVLIWLRSTCDGDLYELMNIFRLHQISGMTLVKLTDDILKNELDIKQLGLREQLLYERDKLLNNYRHIRMDNFVNITNDGILHPSNIENPILCNDINTNEALPLQLENKKEEEETHETEWDDIYIDLKPMNTFKAEKSISNMAYDNTEVTQHRESLRHLNIISEAQSQTHDEFEIFNPNGWVPWGSYHHVNNKLSIPEFEVVDDYYILYQYEHYGYLQYSNTVIDEYCVQLETKTTYSIRIPNEIRTICFYYYFEYDYYILQFAYDISRMVATLDVSHHFHVSRNYHYLFTGTSLIAAFFTQYRYKYKLKALTYTDIIDNYCKQLVEYDFLNICSIKTIAIINEERDINCKQFLYKYNMDKKAVFDKYQQFAEAKLDRKAWNIGTIIKIYSHTFNGWTFGKIIEINPKNTDDILIGYGSKEYGLIKRVNRKDMSAVKSTRKFILSRDKWDDGSHVEVFDCRFQMWFSAKLISIPCYQFDELSIKAVTSHQYAMLLFEKGTKPMEYEIKFDARCQGMFGQEHYVEVRKWSPNVRNVSDFGGWRTQKEDDVVYDDAYNINRRHLIWIGFARQCTQNIVPSDVIRVIHEFGEHFIIWNIDNDKMLKVLYCRQMDVIMGPKFELSDGILCQLTLCPKDVSNSDTSDPYIVCYLEIVYVPPSIKSITFSVQLYLAELQHDCRGTIFYDMDNKDKRNAWSWGKQAISFNTFIEKHELKSLHIECSVDIIHTTYRLYSQKQDICGYLSSAYKGIKHIWKISNKLLNEFKHCRVRRRYFADVLLNAWWMISCEPKGDDGNVYLRLHLMKLPFGMTSVKVSFQWTVCVNNTEVKFTSEVIDHEFELNVCEGFENSQISTRLCESLVLQRLSQLTFEIVVYDIPPQAPRLELSAPPRDLLRV